MKHKYIDRYFIAINNKYKQIIKKGKTKRVHYI